VEEGGPEGGGPKAKRAAGVARGSLKKKVKKMAQGQRKR